MFIRQDVHLRIGVLLRPRDDSNGTGSGSLDGDDSVPNNTNHTTVIIVASVIAGIAVLGFAWLVFRWWRRSHTAKYSRSGRDDNDHGTSTDGPATAETPSAAGRQGNAASVDRNTSVRSVMTLPPYRPKPLEGEAVLGREGERDGIDVVIEMPTAEDEEAMREEEMDALFQIRLARRRQIAEREERREARRIARERNDQAALQTIREQARAATTNNNREIETLREGHNRAKESRQRAVSSVNYAELGVARHDGTRIRANSSESERVGLLSDAASIGASGRAPSSLGQSSTTRPGLHQRGRSGSSVMTMNTTHTAQTTHTTQTAHSDDAPQLQQPAAQGSRSRASSTGRAGSSPELINAADAEPDGAALPSHSPPGYDEVSLNDLTPVHSHGGSVYNEPPPVYSDGPADAAGTAGAPATESPASPAAAVETDPSSGSRSSSLDSQGNRRLSRQGGIPQLPSLRLTQLPQIVIEPSSAAPREPER